MISNITSGSLIPREYSNFLGVDFSNRKDEISLYRSPDALNVWKNYRSSNGKCIETRPDIELVKEFTDTIFGLFFYSINDETFKIVHSGNKLYKEDEVIYEGLSLHKSNFFVYNNVLYIMDSQHYLRYNGEEVKEVVGYIPTTSISRSPAGGGTIYEDSNILNYYRKNSFCSDGESLEYYLDTPTIDEDGEVEVVVNDNVVNNYSINYEKGYITFDSAPPKPETDGADNVIIQYKYRGDSARERIINCTLVEQFDNRVFFSGNKDYPNFLFHSSLDNPEFCSDLDYYTEGTTDSAIKAIISGSDSLWVLKAPSQSNTTIFYHVPSIDSNYGKVYASTHSSISEGCLTTGRNFKDTIVFYSNSGLEAITTNNITNEQILSHRSSYVDNRLRNEENYLNMILEEWEGYLLTIIDNKIYLSDKLSASSEYEWYYWEFDENITGTFTKDNVLYLCMNNKLVSLTDFSSKREINSYFCTIADEFNTPQYQKTTNKKGCVVDMEGEKVSILVKIDNKNFDLINTYKANNKQYVVPRIKKKKWKSIQMKFSSNKPFSIYSATLEAYVGAYVKR